MSIGMRTPAEQTRPARTGTNDRPDKPRIAVITEDIRSPLDEGAKKTCFHIVQSLTQNGAAVSVFTRYKNPLLSDTFPLPGNKFLIGESFHHSLRTLSPDAILYIPLSSGTLGAFIRAAMIKRQAPGVPLALLNLQYRHLPSAARSLGLGKVIDITFTQSQASTEALRSLGCKTVFLPGGVDCTIFKPTSAEEKRDLRSKYGFHLQDKIVLHVGHVNQKRNVLSLTKLTGMGCRVIFVASTSTEIDSDLIYTLRQAGVTVFVDFIKDIQHFYQMADCYLFPVSNATSAIDTPLSVLEAMACNIPVVSTPFGALPSIFRPGNGLYFIDLEEEIPARVIQAIEAKHCRTLEMVMPFSWERVAGTILTNIMGAGGK